VICKPAKIPVAFANPAGYLCHMFSFNLMLTFYLARLVWQTCLDQV